MLDQIVSLLAIGLMALGAYGLGRSVLAVFRLEDEDRLADGVWSIAIGLVLAGTVTAGLGAAGFLSRPLIAGLWIVAGFRGVASLVQGHARWLKKLIASGGKYDEASARGGSASCSPPARWIAWGAVLLASLACAGSLVGALAPTTDTAALARHLEIPKTFLADHALSCLPDRCSTAPLLAEMWYLSALALDGPVAAQLVAWGLGILLGLASVVLATPVVGRSWAWIVGAVVLLVPEVNHQMQTPLVDLGSALMTTLALAAWRRVVLEDQPRRWLVPAGLAAGGALAVRPEALLFGAAMMIPWAWLCRRQPARWRLLLKSVAIVSLLAAVVAGLWYARAAWYYARAVMESPFGWPTPIEWPFAAGWQAATGQRFEEFRHLGALFLAVVPGVAIARRLRGLGTLLAGALIYASIWWLLGWPAGLLLPAVPPLAVATVWVMVELSRFPAAARWVAAAAIAALAVVDAAGAAISCRDRLPVVLLQETRDDYLRRREPTWPAADVVNQMTRPGTRLLSQEDNTFYFNCPLTLERTYLRMEGARLAEVKPGDFSRVLRESGFTHVLLVDAVGPDGQTGPSLLRRLAERQMTSANYRQLATVCRYQFSEADGTRRRYCLLMLTDP